MSASTAENTGMRAGARAGTPQPLCVSSALSPRALRDAVLPPAEHHITSQHAASPRVRHCSYLQRANSTPVFGPVITTHLVPSSMEMLMGTTASGLPDAESVLDPPFAEPSASPPAAEPARPGLEAIVADRLEVAEDVLLVVCFCMA